MEFNLGRKTITPDGEVFIIAEIGVNHNGSIKLAKQLIELAKDTGADAVKFQTYQAENLVTATSELADYQKKSSFKTQKEMLQQYQLSKQEFVELKEYCDSVDILFLSTPFDLQSADFLVEIGVEAFKIGSGDLTHFPLLSQIASYKKPLIISTGMSTLEEIKATVDFIPGDVEYALLHCTSAYPAPYEDLHLRVIEQLKEEFNCLIGYSDHSMGLEIPFAAATLGYKILEKHFTLDRNLKGPDHVASLIPNEFKQMVEGIRKIEKAMGTNVKQITPVEIKTKEVVRRGIYAAQDLTKGHVITSNDLDYLRPVTGIEACHYQEVIGKIIVDNKNKGEPLTWKDIKRGS